MEVAAGAVAKAVVVAATVKEEIANAALAAAAAMEIFAVPMAQVCATPTRATTVAVMAVATTTKAIDWPA